MRECFLLPYSVALESYVKAFHYKVLNNVLYTNKNYLKLVSEQTKYVLFVRPNQKLCTIFFTSALTQGDFGAILNLIGAFYQINRFVLFAECYDLV